MKALIFIGLLILIVCHPIIGILAMVIYCLLVGRSSSPRPSPPIIYRHEVVVRETIYASPSYMRAEELRALARVQATQAQAHVPPHQEHRPRPPYYPWELEKLAPADFSQLN